MRGSLAVSTSGGGTCNTEFEFLCGVSLGLVGQGIYPFSFFDLSEAPSLPRQFDALGYATVAMHPNLASNYNRMVVYPDLGFQEFLDIDDFEGAPWYHSGVSDAATFERILELLREDPGPQLIYDLTMQNHSAYNQNNLGGGCRATPSRGSTTTRTRSSPSTWPASRRATARSRSSWPRCGAWTARWRCSSWATTSPTSASG